MLLTYLVLAASVVPLRASVAVQARDGAAAPPVRGQPAGKVGGRVVDSHTAEPVIGAAVRLTRTALFLSTDETGDFSFAAVPVGVHILEVEHVAFGVIRTDSFRVTDGETIRITVRASMRAIEVPPLEVTVPRVGNRTATRVFSRDDLERLAVSVRDVGELLEARIPGVTVALHQRTRGIAMTGTCLEYRGGGRSFSRTRPGEDLDLADRFGARQIRPSVNTPRPNENRCVEIFLDGVRTPDADFFVMDLPLGDVQRIEFLTPAEARLRYGTLSGNGVLLIYTRRR